MRKERRAPGSFEQSFMRRATHELRTPMTIAVGYMEMINDGTLGPIPENLKPGLEIAHEAILKLDKIIELMLTESRLEWSDQEEFNRDHHHDRV